MADLENRAVGVSAFRTGTAWGAIWAGMFVFAAIWTVFEMLGAAIFQSTGTLPAAGPHWGMGIWTIVLTAIAMFVAGGVTGRLSGVATRNDGAMCGMAMFGLSAVAVLVLVLLRRAAIVPVATASPHVLAITASAAWFGFFALLAGWLCAMGGASAGAGGAVRTMAAPVRDIRTAA